MTPTRARPIPIGDVALDGAEAGEGAPVILLHGALADRRIWAPHLTLLAPRLRAVAYTQRHFGPGDEAAGGAPFGVAAHARDLLAVMDALGLPRAAVVAWSYAGHVALHAALAAPGRFSRLVLHEPGVRTLPLPEPEAARVAADARAVFGPIVGAVAEGRLEEAARRLIDASGGPGHFDALPPARRAVYRDNARTLPLLLAQEEPPPMSLDDLRRLPVPVDVLWGGVSRPVTRLPAMAVAAARPGGRHEEIAGTGHLWPEEEPCAFADAILARIAG